MSCGTCGMVYAMTGIKRGIARSGSTLGALVAERRRAKKLTQAQLADLAGVPHRTIGRWESAGVARPDFALVRQVCDALDISDDEAMAAMGFTTTAKAA